MVIRTSDGKISAMATMRTYDDGCAAHALDLVGERWALLVVHELLLGPKSFTDLRAGIPKASLNVLTQRLRELERTGVVHRRELPSPAASKVYELTNWGMEFEPVVISLGRWGARSTSKPCDAELGIDSLILSFRRMFDPRAAERLVRATSCGSARTASAPWWTTAGLRSPVGARSGPTRPSRPTPARWPRWSTTAATSTMRCVRGT
jgi:DNA-binding HxlR family transcriptional regulator